MTSSFNAAQLAAPPFSVFAFQPIPSPLSSPFACCLFLTFLPASERLSTFSPLLHVSPLAHPPSLCSQVSDRPISAPMIVAGVLAWQLSRQWQEPEPSLGANVASAATAELLSLRQTDRRGRARDRQGEREMKRGRRHPLPSSHSPAKQSPWSSHFANCMSKTFNFSHRRPSADGRQRLVGRGILQPLSILGIGIIDTSVLCTCPSLPWQLKLLS